MCTTQHGEATVTAVVAERGAPTAELYVRMVLLRAGLISEVEFGRTDAVD